MASATTPRPLHVARGSTVVLTMIFLALFAILSVAFSAGTNMNLRQARNYSSAQRAQMAAESGLGYLLAYLETIAVPAADAEADLLCAVANRLAGSMDNTGNLGAAEVTYDGTTISIPSITLAGANQAFRATIAMDAAAGTPRLTVHGQSGEAQRVVAMRLNPKTVPSHVFDYGIASRGKILVGGDGTVTGVNNAGEADVLSATYSSPTAIEISGSCRIDGDLYTSNPNSTVRITGSPTIAGLSKSAAISNHIHIGVGDVTFPEIDTDLYRPFATNVIDRSTSTSSDMVLSNVIIRANTNPTFSGNVTIQGVMYVEQPNIVKFSGGATIVGVIATQDPGENMFTSNVLEFSGNTSFRGVEALPETPEFTQLRKLPGTAILAPGFGVKLTGSFDTISGAIAADKFTITGNSTGRISGPIICYGDTEFSLWGSTRLDIDRSKYGKDLPGFKNPVSLVAVSDSYTEVH